MERANAYDAQLLSFMGVHTIDHCAARLRRSSALGRPALPGGGAFSAASMWMFLSSQFPLLHIGRRLCAFCFFNKY